MGTTLLQIPIDDSLSREAASVFENFGSDTPTAVRSFLQQAAAKSASFTMTLPQYHQSVPRGRQALLEMNELAEENGLSEMSLDEINAEIAAARQERRAKMDDANGSPPRRRP